MWRGRTTSISSFEGDSFRRGTIYIVANHGTWLRRAVYEFNIASTIYVI